MATYYSNRVAADGSHYIRREQGLTTDYCIATDASTALVLNDTIKLFTLPKGAIIAGLVFGGTARNSGNDRVITVGDAGDTSRLLLSGSGTFSRNSNSTSYNYTAGLGTTNHSGTGSSVVMTKGFGYKYTADTDIIATVATAGTGNAADWVINCMIQYFIQS